jgi:hypothetical protein
MSNTITTRHATIPDIDAARHGEALWARFRNGVTGPWRDGYLVGWIQCDQPWVCGRFADTDHLVEECDYYQYCEVYCG